MAKTLKDLHIGKRGVIAKVDGSGAVRRRLLDMGLVPGCDVKVCKVAPLGDPIEITVRGYQLSLRKAEAAMIELN